MFDELDKYILGFTLEDLATDYWYDEGVDIAEKMLYKFANNDWKILLEIVSERTIEWQRCLAYCMHNGHDLNQLRVLLRLADTDDIELFEIVVDYLRGFTDQESLSLIQNNPQIISKVKELLPKSGDAVKKIFEEFLKQQVNISKP